MVDAGGEKNTKNPTLFFFKFFSPPPPKKKKKKKKVLLAKDIGISASDKRVKIKFQVSYNF